MKEYKFTIFIWNDLNEWSKERMLKMIDFKLITKVLFKEIIYKYKYSQKIIMNNKNENKKITKILLKYYWIK